MRDGRTHKKMDAAEREFPLGEFAARWCASLVVLTGDRQGMDYPLDQSSTVVGRGPGVDLAFEDDTMSREHVAVEYGAEGLRVRDLGSLNGIRLNGGAVSVGELKHGDRLQVGEHIFQLILEERRREPKTYFVPDS